MLPLYELVPTMVNEDPIGAAIAVDTLKGLAPAVVIPEEPRDAVDTPNGLAPPAVKDEPAKGAAGDAVDTP